MLVSVPLFSGLSSESSVPAGRAANASLVGANTVNGPAPDSVSTRPAALTAATRVEKSELPDAICTMFCVAAGVAAGEATIELLLVVPQAARSIPLTATAASARYLFPILISSLLG